MLFKSCKSFFLYFISKFKISNFAIDDLKQPREEVVGLLEGSYAHELVNNLALELWFDFGKTGSLKPALVMKSLKHIF